jgi:hypothetical protein
MAVVDATMNLLTRKTANALAERLGTSATAAHAGVATSVAALMAAMSNRADDASFLIAVFNMVKTADTESILQALPGLASGMAAAAPTLKEGSRFSSLLLNGQQAHVEDLIGRESGFTGTAGHELMSFAAPLTAGFLGHEIRSLGLTSASFAEMVRSEASSVQTYLPAGLPILLSVVAAPPLMEREIPPVRRDGNAKILYAVVCFLLLGLVAWLIAHGCRRSASSPLGVPQASAH